MELKRYVLYKTEVSVSIIDTKSKEFEDSDFYDENGTLCLYSISRGVVNLQDKVVKQSDNILDLVEPCSLWDLAGDLYEYNIGSYVMIDKVFKDTDFNKREVTAIYKRQPNGDYKRYEVLS